jgi:flagellar hook-associated protein 3 FlgL
MRVTESMALRDFLRDLEGARAKMLHAQNQTSTGLNILRPSDSPRDMSDILQLEANKTESDQYVRNLEYGRSKLDFADTALASIQGMIERVRFLGLSSIATGGAGQTYATEVAGLREQLLGTANSALQGRYVFGGSDGATLPFVEDSAGAVTYQGASDDMEVQVGRNATLRVQLPGDQLFGGTDVFQAITDLIAALNSGNQSQIDAMLKPIEAAWEGVSLARTRVGNLVNVADSVSDEIDGMSLARAGNLSDIQSADLARTLTEFQSYENAVQATLAVGARISQLTLLDYI